MLRRSLAAVALAALIAGCGASHPTGPVTAVVDLERAPSGAPDGGRPGGHGGGGLEATTERSMLAFHGRVRPPVAQLVVRGARASVTVSPSGAFLVWLRGVRPGTTVVRLLATAPGRPSWHADVNVLRAPSGVPRRYEVQGTEPNRGTPGNEDPSGGKVDLGIRDFAFFPARVRMRVSQIAVWHNLDHVEHTIVATGSGPPGPGAQRLRFNDRYEFTALKPGVVHYACTIHPWVRGELVIARPGIRPVP